MSPSLASAPPAAKALAEGDRRRSARTLGRPGATAALALLAGLALAPLACDAPSSPASAGSPAPGEAARGATAAPKPAAAGEPAAIEPPRAARREGQGRRGTTGAPGPGETGAPGPGEKATPSASAEAARPAPSPTARRPAPAAVPPLQIETLRKGHGAPVRQGDRVLVHWTATLSGGELVSTTRGGAPRPLRLAAKEGDDDDPILALREGLAGMREGEVRRLTAPARFAYGRRGLRDAASGDWIVPPGATLRIELELVAVSRASGSVEGRTP